MGRIEGEIIIHRPVEEVFDFVADERNEPKFNPQMTQSEMITPEPVSVGTRFHTQLKTRGRVTSMTVEYTVFERPHRLGSVSTLSTMTITGGLTLEAVAEGTRMRWSWTLAPRGWLRLANPLIRLIGKRQERATWSNLKRLLESRSPPC